jgi:hypothetical protein
MSELFRAREYSFVRCVVCKGRGWYRERGRHGLRVCWNCRPNYVPKKPEFAARGGAESVAKRYRERKADVQCQNCGSHYLETETRCAVCAEKHRVSQRLSL